VIPEAATDDDAFGAQLILKERLRKKELQASAEIGAYHTSNVALARSGALGDAFLNTTLGLSWRHDFTDRLTLAISARYGLFRYSRYSVLDFQSTETDVTFGYKLGANWELGLGYAYTQLNARTDNTEFYCEHAVNVGLQRVFEVDDRNAIIAGIGSSWTWADPEAAQRDKYAAFLGWRWRATERISTTLLYRYARYEYRDGGTGRGDHNQTLSLSVRYDATDWLALTASGFSTWNRSNQTAFDYEAWNLGGNIGVNARF
jgi:outer membrane protein assembly factor BamA